MRYKYIYNSLVIVFVLFNLMGCDADPYRGFGCIAPESHPAVSHARSLSPEQLETIYVEVQKLSKLHAKESYETEFLRAEIPESLYFLEAELIRVYQSRAPYIILANCRDERIELTLSPPEQTEATITLHWAEPTRKNPYAIGSQIIWRKDKGE